MPADTPSRLRQEIDSGRTHDKVAASDPAAAPLGTDEEAAGTPIAPEAVRIASRHESRPTGRAPAFAGSGLVHFLAWLIGTVGIFALSWWLIGAVVI